MCVQKIMGLTFVHEGKKRQVNKMVRQNVKDNRQNEVLQ